MESIWINGGRKENQKENQKENLTRQRLPENVDTAIIGGGMAGILCGWFLQESGIQNVVLEAESVGSGQTGKTTAKITSQHGLIYSRLWKEIGADGAVQYGHASQAAIDEYAKIISQKQIECEFERLPAYLYTKTDEGAEKLEQERTAMIKAGIPASIVYETGLPFPVKKALKTENQAQFDPIKFLCRLASELSVFEQTRVTKVKGHEIVTTRGRITARNIIFASHFPIVDFPGFYFARMYQKRSYVLALKAGEQKEKAKEKTKEKTKEEAKDEVREERKEKANEELKGMYYGIDSDGLSFRNAKGLILLGGKGHRTGECGKENPYEMLRQEAEKIWGTYTEMGCWSAQDCITLDSVPYIGRFSRFRPYWYVASGFGKWGMTNSMVSALAIRDEITGRKTERWKVFSPQRKMSLLSYKNMFLEFGHSIKNFVVPGGPRCPHLGCRLCWNRAEKTWECPCHGSRFQESGGLLDDPAKKGIKKPGPYSSL